MLFQGLSGVGAVPAVEPPRTWPLSTWETGSGRHRLEASWALRREQLWGLVAPSGQDRLWSSPGAGLCVFPTQIGKGTGPPSPTKDRKKDVSSHSGASPAPPQEQPQRKAVSPGFPFPGGVGAGRCRNRLHPFLSSSLPLSRDSHPSLCRPHWREPGRWVCSYAETAASPGEKDIPDPPVTLCGPTTGKVQGHNRRAAEPERALGRDGRRSGAQPTVSSSRNIAGKGFNPQMAASGWL